MDKNSIDIWKISFLNISISKLDLEILSDDELNKATRFKNSFHQDRYRYMHISLRKILSKYISYISPSQWVFTTNKYGKPFIDNTLEKRLNFSITYSEDIGYILISQGSVCGIDVEILKDIELTKELQEITLSYNEQNSLINSIDRLKQFYIYWTLKESFVKALGVGLNLSINKLCFASYCDIDVVEKFFIANNHQYFYCYNEKEKYILSLTILDSSQKCKLNFKSFYL